MRPLLKLLWALAGVAFATPVWAHASLLATDPPYGAVLATAPATITLTFDEPTDPTVLRLVGPDGAEAELTDFAKNGNDIIVSLPPLGRGTQTLSWRVISADSHPVGGSLAFSIGEVTGAATISLADNRIGPPMWAARTALYLALFIGVAGAAFVALIAAPAKLPPRARMALRWFMIAGFGAVPALFVLQGVDILGEPIESIFKPDAWRAAVTSTYMGTLVVALIALVLGLAVQRTGNRFAALVSLLAIGTAFALSGHASRAPPAATSWSIVLIHTVSVAFWIGALLPLASLLRSADRAAIAALARFSAVIPFAIAPLLISGLVLILIQLDRLSDLWTTGYGLILSGKVLLVGALLTIAFVNRYHLTPRLSAKPARAAGRLRRSIFIELALTILVFGLVAGWRFTPPPRAVDAAIAATEAPFFTHFHGTDIATDVTVTPGYIGPVSVAVTLYDGDLAPLAAQQVTVSLSNPDAGIEPITEPATRVDGQWIADGFVLAIPGNWTLEVAALISDFERRRIAGPVLIRGNNTQPVAIAAAPATATVATGLVVTGAYLQTVIATVPAAGYFTLENTGDTDRVLVSASSPGCGALMMHQSQDVGGVGQMIAVDTLLVPAHGSVTFSPGGYHLMCISPGDAVTPGGTVPVTLTFADGGALTVDFPVRRPTD